MLKKVFQRYEYKYLLNEKQFKKITSCLNNNNVKLDPYCKNNTFYKIYSIYCDNDNNDIIRNSLEKPLYKEKLRIRSYYLFDDENTEVFFELKKKVDKVVTKRRMIIPYKDVLNIFNNKKIKLNNYVDEMVYKEIKYFIKRNNVYPKVFISYDRLAYTGDNELRISFDKNINSRRFKLDFSLGMCTGKILEDNMYLMEIKSLGAMPLYLSKLLNEEKIYRSSFSKYGKEYKNYLGGYIYDRKFI